MNDNAISLYELNNLVKRVIQNNLSELFWVRAEMSDVRINQNGHCYLEFIEKDIQGKSVIAKTRAMIWSNVFVMLREYFETTTKQPFASGLKVLVKVSVEYHELYGFSVRVHDIDPSYTLGDQAMNRAMILKQLQEEGVLDLNKELELPMPTNRIAIISSPTAAGYEDFINQLENNQSGFVFYTKLFPAIMQGDRAEESIINALESIYAYIDAFDAVVIIRGGGATSDLSCFDSYLLATSCAQFPLPIITGIGHERDETVLDIVAHTRAKTPTAVAEFLINEMGELAVGLENIRLGITASINERMQTELLQLNTYETHTNFWLKNWNKNQQQILNNYIVDLQRVTKSAMRNAVTRLDSFEKLVSLISPTNILKKGYSITLKDGKTVRTSKDAKKGDTLTTVMADGKIESIVK